jgi:hypothetical protein
MSSPFLSFHILLDKMIGELKWFFGLEGRVQNAETKIAQSAFLW